MMKSIFWIFVVIAIVNQISALTEEELSIIAKRNENRKCGGYMKAVATGNSLLLERDVIPDHVWGCTNPNAPKSIPKSTELPNYPEFDADGPNCLSMGEIGVALNGVSFYNALTHFGENAVEGSTQEIFDCCDAHTSPDGNYHYHKLPLGDGCDNPIFDSKNQENPQFIGVALDGFPIYGQWNGLDKDALDECHGTNLPDGRYAYIAVKEHYPYILGCFKGKSYGTMENGGKKSCSGMVAGQACSCQRGIDNYEDVTKETKTKRHISETQSNIRRTLMSLFTKASEDGSLGGCHIDQCILNPEGWGYENGQCVCSGDNCKGPPNGGGDNNRPGPNGGGDNHRPGPNGGGDNNRPGPNGGGDNNRPGPNGGGDNNRPFPPHGGGDNNRPFPPHGGGDNNRPFPPHGGGGNRPFPPFPFPPRN